MRSIFKLARKEVTWDSRNFMQNPYDKAYELVKALQASDAYTRLKSAREKLEADPAALDMLQDYRKRQWEVQSKLALGQSVSDADRAMLERLSEVVRLNQDARAYLDAEFHLMQIMMDIQGILGKAIDEATLPSPVLSSDADVSK
ncbi:MAG: YlbF family regulator [Alicyclobacillus sp.]|nr:YlbF family regulator [Alicyclobacillus sp.]